MLTSRRLYGCLDRGEFASAAVAAGGADPPGDVLAQRLLFAALRHCDCLQLPYAQRNGRRGLELHAQQLRQAAERPDLSADLLALGVARHYYHTALLAGKLPAGALYCAPECTL